MRWGEPTRLPPLRRGRGLTAAALLTVGLVAAYVVLGVLSLTSVAPSTLLKSLPKSITGVVAPGAVAARQQSVDDYITPKAGPSIVSTYGTSLNVHFGRQQEAATLTSAITLTNNSAASVDLAVDVVGAPGVVATFPGTAPTKHLRADASTSIAVSTSPLHAGPLHGYVRVTMKGLKGAKPLLVPLSGDQAPLPPDTVTATPTAGGAVHVTWSASASTGVAGYQVDRRVSGGGWQMIRTSAPAAGIVDNTGTDAQAVEYRVRAITAGVLPTLVGVASAPGTAVTDASPPDLPTDVAPPGFVNQDNENAVPVKVFLPQTSAPTDVVSVTLTNPTTGDSASATTAGGQSSVSVNIDASQIPDGMLNATSTVTDAVGNTSTVFNGTPVLKDTVAPDAPTDVHAPGVVNGDEAAAVPVTVHVADPEAGERVHVEITGGGNTADQSADVDGAATTLSVDASGLPDGDLTVSAWTVDAAGNASDPFAGGTIHKDTSAPNVSARLRVTGGDSNPAGYVNAASAGAVTVAVKFQQPTDAADTIVISVGGTRLWRQGGDDTYFVGPLDLTDVPDGPLPLAVTVTDPAGNSTTTRDTAIKDTVAPEAPTSFTVPESADNAAGFVNSLNQSSAIIQATFPDGTDSSDTLTASVDGVDLGAQVGGSIAVAWRADVSGFADGTLDLDGTITDAAGNSTDFSGRAVKETQPPAPPVAAHVIGACRPDTITPQTAGDVSVQVALPDAPGMSGTVTVTLTDSAGHTASGSAWGDRGIVVVHGIDASSFVPGHVHVSVSVTDSAGNTSTFDGTTAVLTDA
jgi:hypothetical protein